MEYDYIHNINSIQLTDEIFTAGIPAADYILTSGTDVQIFYTNELSEDDKSILDTTVSAHVANQNYITLAVQAQVAKLISYLNSATPGVGNLARAAIITTMASKMPLAALMQINTTIQGQVGY